MIVAVANVIDSINFKANYCSAESQYDINMSKCQCWYECWRYLQHFFLNVLYDQDGLTALMLAATKGSVAAIEVLLSNGANIEASDKVSNCDCIAYYVNDWRI